MEKLFVIKTKECCYVTTALKASSSWSSGYSQYFNNKEINRLPILKSWHRDWIITKDIPKSITQNQSQPNINHRYELIDTSFESDTVPLVFKREDVAEYEDSYWDFKDEYSHLRSLYREVSDPQPDKEVELEFKIEEIIEVDKVDFHSPFSYKVQKGQWKHQGTTEITQKNTESPLLDKLLFPSLVLPSRPCKLSSVETYKIVRQYIKDNIDPKVAVITSDYNFCFTVRKKVKLNTPLKYSVDVNAGKRGRSKYVERVKNHKEVEIFEMTNSSDNYKGYSVIQGFEGENQTDLKNKIDFYLKDLISYINEPILECPTCKGDGAIVNKTYKREE